MKYTAAAFFDLDRTLIDRNSGLMWAIHERKSRQISARQMARAVFWTGLYHLSLIDMETAIRHALSHYRGVSSDELAGRTQTWFNSQVASCLRPKARQAFEDHRRQGHALIILTNSSCYEAAAATEAWQFDGYLANQFDLDERGCLTGHFEPPLCYGPGKVTRAMAWAEQHGVTMERCYFYSDSYSDLPMLERVGQPRVVCPDPRLRYAARRRKWPILIW